MDNNLNIHVKPLGLLDLLEFKRLVPNRKRIIEKGPVTPVNPAPHANSLAAALHPAVQYLTVSEITDHSNNIRSYTLVPDTTRNTTACACFRAGQYLSVKININGHPVTRPISISSSPKDALEGFYTLSIKLEEDGFVSPYIHENWKEGTQVTTSGPEGTFFYERLRDADTVVGIAGGCGITPFRSMAKAIAEGTEDFTLLLLYGNRHESDIAFQEECAQLEELTEGKFRAVHVISEETTGNTYETGFISADIIRKYAPSHKPYSLFLCGPEAMYDFLEAETALLDLDRKYIRHELYGEKKNITSNPDYPAHAGDSVFTMTVHINGAVSSIPAAGNETLLTALERGKIAAPSSCRSGECGYCRSRLLSGEIYVPEDSDKSRGADKKFGYIHSCIAYPESDIEMEISP